MKFDFASGGPRGIHHFRVTLAGKSVATVVGLSLIVIFSTTPYWQYFFVNLILLAVVVISMDLLIGWSGIFALHSASLFVIGEYMAPIAQVHLKTGTAIALLLAAVAATVVSLAFALFAIRVRGILLSLVTIFVAVILPSAILAVPSLTGGGDGILVPPTKLFGVSMAGRSLLVTSAGLLVLAFVFYRVLLIHGWGARLRLLARSETGLAALGVRPGTTKFGVFAISAPLVGIAGGLYAYYLSYVGITDFLSTTVFLYMALMIGGAASVLGPYIGVVLVFGIPQFMSTIGPYRLGIFGLMLLGVATVAPFGIAGLIADGLKLLLRLLRFVGLRTGIGAPTDTRPSVNGRVARTATVKAVTSSTGPLTVGGRLEARQLEKRFGSVVGLASCSVALEPGRILGLVGPNGSGKSTLINVISGVYRADAGAVLLDGRDIGGLGSTDIARRGVRRTFQVPLMPDRVRGWEAVAMAVGDGRHPVAAEMKARDEMEYLGISELADLRMDSIPLGERRLVNIAQVLAPGPQYILLDEPLSGVTSEEATRIAVALREVAARGVGVFVVEHQLEWTLGLADVVAVMERGTVVDQGPPAEVRNTVNRIVRGVTEEYPEQSGPTSGRRRVDNSNAPALQVKGLTIAYGGAPVVQDASFSLETGQILAIIGPNGAGKSSLLRGVAGTIPALAGKITVSGKDLSRSSPHTRARNGLILAGEGRPLFRSMTVRENLEVGSGLGRRRNRDRYDQILEIFEPLVANLDRAAGSLSGGQQQMLVLAQALLAGPSVLLLDEPTLGLSEAVATNILTALSSALTDDISVVICGEWDSVQASQVDVVMSMDRGDIRPVSHEGHEQSGTAESTEAVTVQNMGYRPNQRS